MAQEGDKSSRYSDLRLEQVRQLVDSEQAYEAFRIAEAERRARFAGAMSWKEVSGRGYLYRKQRNVWKSLGPRSDATELAYRQFHDGRERNRDRLAGLAKRLDEMAPVNRAFGLGRVPLLVARALRAFDRAGFLDAALEVVGTNALFAYERMAGVQIASGHLATADVDLLSDARARLRLVADGPESDTILGLLQKIDRSFELTGPGSFRAVNRDGYMVDLIQPMPKDRIAPPRRNRPAGSDDLTPVDIEGLVRLVSSPKVRATVIDERGYPARISVPDPRAFALHKLWLARREDRDPAKRSRDEAQGRLVMEFLATRLPHLRFDDPCLSAIPLDVRASAPRRDGDGPDHDSLEPDW